MLNVMLNGVTVVLSLIAIVTGLRAAYLWREASEVKIQPDKEALGRTKDPAFIALAHMRAATEAWERAGRLNSRAAVWTAISVAAQAFVTVRAWYP